MSATDATIARALEHSGATPGTVYVVCPACAESLVPYYVREEDATPEEWEGAECLVCEGREVVP